jgi:hypothetical protein
MGAAIEISRKRSKLFSPGMLFWSTFLVKTCLLPVDWHESNRRLSHKIDNFDKPTLTFWDSLIIVGVHKTEWPLVTRGITEAPPRSPATVSGS